MLKTLLYKKFSGVPVNVLMLLGALTFAGYWPISSNLFSLKNDAYIYFLPCRYFISECIRSGHLPLWNPYFYMGFPLHGDIQGGVWNPIVILFSLFTRYNMTVLQYETLLYIFIAGIGMYKLLAAFGVSNVTKITLAVCYIFCGFIIDTGQITVWIASAAFVPFVFLYYYRLLYQQDKIYVNALKTSLALYFLFSAGYPAFLIMCGYTIFFAFIFKCFHLTKQHPANKKIWAPLLKANLLLAVSFLLISLPALLSYIDYFPYYQRSSGTTLQEALQNPFDPFAAISYIFPLSVTRDHPFITTDPAARNAFIGLFPFLLLAGIFRKKITGMQKFIIAATIFFFLFSLGDAVPLRALFYHYVPLMNLFRHPANMRLFTSIGIVILAAFSMDELLIGIRDNKTKFYQIATSILMAAITVSVCFYFKDSHLFEKTTSFLKSFFSSPDKRGSIKIFYDSLTFPEAILSEGSVQIIFLLIFLLLIKRRSQVKWIAMLFMTNAMLLAQLSIPDTFVTQRSPEKINSFIRSGPAGYPIPDIHNSIEQNNATEEATHREFGCASFYTKNLVQVKEELNPSFTSTLRTFDLSPAINKVVLQYPLCYFADTLVHLKDSANIVAGKKKILFLEDTTAIKQQGPEPASSTIIINQFAPWGLFFTTNASQPKPFVLFQNYNKNWKLFVDGKEAPVYRGNISFMYANVDSGFHQLQFFYRPPYLIPSFIICVITLLVCIIILIRSKRNEPAV